MDDENAHFGASEHNAQQGDQAGSGRPRDGLIPVSSPYPDALSASANLEVSLGEGLPRVSAGAHVPATHASTLMLLMIYMVGAAFATGAVACVALAGVSAWLAGPLALAQVVGCAYLLITRG